MKALASSTADRPRAASERRLRLLLVDDSVVARAVLSRMVEADGGFEIAGVAGTAEDAIAALAHVEVDIVLLDLEMPGAGGLKSIPDILRVARGARIMIVSSMVEEGAEDTVAALALGAADTLPKPGTGRFNGRFSEILLARLRALGAADESGRGDRRTTIARPQPSGPSLRSMSNEPLKLLALGASTGGIHALGLFFQNLPRRIGIPILITQHLPAAFLTVFARQLGVAAGRPAVIAEDGMMLRDDVLTIAPGDAHMAVEDTGHGLAVRLLGHAASSGCMPSVDPMFASMARVLGPHGLGVVLTGMGRDGFEGATKLVACGGAVLAQDQGSSAVWGMPRAIADGGLAAAILPPDKLARRVAVRCEER